MKRTFADRSDWRRLKEKRFNLTSIDKDGLKGSLSIIHINKVREPLVIQAAGNDLCLANDGFIWTQYFPEGCYYALTSMFNENQEIIQLYFDICCGNKIDGSGMPYYDDLYLDVVLLPTGEVLLLDEDELEQALKEGDITEEQLRLAYTEAEKLISSINENKDKMLTQSKECLEYMLSLEKRIL